MSKYHSSSASNSTSITKVNKTDGIEKFNMDDLDNALCPPALSPYALSILDDRLDRKKNKRQSSVNMNAVESVNNEKSEKIEHSNFQSKPNTITSMTFNGLTKTSKLNSMNIANSATTTSLSRHSKFMKKLNLGAPRRLTNDGDFQVSQTSRKSLDHGLRIPTDYNTNNLTNMNTNTSSTRQYTEPEVNTRFEDTTQPSDYNKENEPLENNNKERKHSLQITPMKYSPLHKRVTLGLENVNRDSIKLVVDTPVRKRHEISDPNKSIDSPEIGRRSTITNPAVSEFSIDRNILGLFDSTNGNGNVLNLDDFSNKNTRKSYNPNSTTLVKQTNTSDIEQLQSIIDKKKEIYSLKQEIKQYKLELGKQQKMKEKELLEKEQEADVEREKSLEINKHKYKLFEQIGKGGSSKVYRASVIDSPHRYLAIKIVNLEDQELSTIAELKGEIKILHKLRHCPRVVRLLDYSLTAKRIFFVMECGDLDLATVLSNRHMMKRFYDLEFIRYHSQEMIKCIDAIHEMDVVHLDLKPANFVFVSGVLKLIDFGISNSIKGHTVNVYREYQMGTPNYMAPETLLDCAESDNGASVWKVGKPADIWSLGCILYQVTYGTTPYASYTGTKKILAITNPSISISYPSTAVNLRKKANNEKKTNDGAEVEKIEIESDIKVCPYLIDMIRKCLIRDPTKRITCKELMKSVFINPIVVDKAVIKEVVRGCVGFGGRHPELKNVALGTVTGTAINKEDRKAQERLDRLIDGVWERVSNDRNN